HFRKARDLDAAAGWLRRVGVPAFWFGAAMLAKASALVYAPLCLLVVELERLARLGAFRSDPPASGWLAWLRHAWQVLRPLRREGIQIGVLGLVLTFVYCGSDWQPEPSFLNWARNLPEGTQRDAMLWVASTCASSVMPARELSGRSSTTFTGTERTCWAS